MEKLETNGGAPKELKNLRRKNSDTDCLFEQQVHLQQLYQQWPCTLLV
jgi:hypothetical protein